jgi:GTPase SAR1 family protein
MGNLFKKGEPKNVQPKTTDPPKTPDPLTSNASKKKRTFKFNIFNVGDLGVGKTSLALKFLGLDFKENVVPDYTIFDTKTKTLDIASARCVLSFLDTGGQERFKTITNTAYQRAHIIMVCK